MVIYENKMEYFLRHYMHMKQGVTVNLQSYTGILVDSENLSVQLYRPCTILISRDSFSTKKSKNGIDNVNRPKQVQACLQPLRCLKGSADLE